jgi:hypothetical protein
MLLGLGQPQPVPQSTAACRQTTNNTKIYKFQINKSQSKELVNKLIKLVDKLIRLVNK